MLPIPFVTRILSAPERVVRPEALIPNRCNGEDPRARQHARQWQKTLKVTSPSLALAASRTSPHRQLTVWSRVSQAEDDFDFAIVVVVAVGLTTRTVDHPVARLIIAAAVNMTVYF